MACGVGYAIVWAYLELWKLIIDRGISSGKEADHLFVIENREGQKRSNVKFWCMNNNIA